MKKADRLADTARGIRDYFDEKNDFFGAEWSYQNVPKIGRAS